MNEAFERWLKKQYKIPRQAVSLSEGPVYGIKSAEAAERHLSAVIPVSFGIWGDVCLISCYEELLPLMRRYVETGREFMFEDASLAWLNEQLIPHLEARGYEPSRYWSKWGYTCLADDSKQIRRDILRRDTVRIKNAGGLLPYRNRTTYQIDEVLHEGRMLYATVEHRTLLSVAVTHAGKRTPGAVEIGVETAPEARGRGLAAANTAALALALLENGETVIYQCNRYNTVSLKTALKAGFRIEGRFFHYVAHLQL